MNLPSRMIWLSSALLLLATLPLRADDIQLPTEIEIEDALPEGATLSGREIWDRFLDNRMHSAVQHQLIISSDPGGGEQKARFWVRWKDFRDSEDASLDGVVAKTLVRFREPPDMRGTAFLMILNQGRSSDQFIYSPSSRKIKRIKLRGVGVMGTDYTLDDIAFRDIEDADYKRLNDEEIDGVPVYVVESTLKPFVESQYRTARTYLEKEHYVPLHVIYKDENDVPIREAFADHASITEYDGVWIPSETRMHNLKQRTNTRIIIEKLEANPDIGEHLFSVFRLALRR